MKYITKTIWLLSLISLFTDMASEMLYPIMPIYLDSIGFSVLLIGILEGVAEATAGLCKGYFGKLSDVTAKRAPFVQIGYGLSALSKPMMGIFAYPVWIFFARTLDRLGKGIRTGARDALLSDEATPETKGKIFGFHRSMDTLGAVLGPTFALLYLYFYPNEYKTLFFIAFLPGVLSIIASFLLKEKARIQPKTDKQPAFFSFLSYWHQSPIAYRKVVIGLLIFTLFNSSDAFLLLNLKKCGLNDTEVVGVYIFYNLVYALCAFPVGIVADKIGLKRTYLSGLVAFAIVYAGMAMNHNIYIFLGLFVLYGLYAAATEGVSKAWISNLIDKKDTATAIGTFSGFQSICALLANTLTGLIWWKWGATLVFLLTALMSLAVCVYFLMLPQTSLLGIKK